MPKIEKEELNYLKKVQSFIDKEIITLNNLSVDLEEKILSEGKKFSLDNPYASVYGGVAITEHHNSMERKILRAETAKQDAYFLEKLRNNPYFARVDFAEDGYDPEAFYIGIKSLFDEKELAPYVYDWRAPIASLFYEIFDDEKAYFEAPSGRIEGDVIRRRQYKFKNGELVYCFDSDIKIDDLILQKTLSEGSTDRLKVIVSSIQKEQNRAIRFADNKNLIVCGPAGSGKTSVGFHRIAYLLYRNRDTLSSSEIIMFTGSDIFASYVSDIIPELGEAPIRDFNFYKLIKRYIKGCHTKDYFELADDLINKNEARQRSVEIKYSEDFCDFLKNCAEEKTYHFSSLNLYDDVVYTGEELNEFLKQKKKTKNFFELLSALTEYTEEKINSFFTANYQKIYAIINEETDILVDTAKQISAICKQVKNNSAALIKKELDGDDGKLLSDAYKLYEEKNGLDNSISSTFEKKLKHGTVDFEDAVMMIYIKCVLGKITQNINARHILIDEAQDFAPVQHLIIKYLYPKANFTILTDSRQAILPCANTTDIDRLKKAYSADVLKINKSYRSTLEISEYAKSLLPEKDSYETFERSGEKPETIETTDTAGIIKTLLKEHNGSMCIITKTMGYANELYNKLAMDFDIELYNDMKKTFSDKIAIMSVAFSKGLEFDNVIIASSEESDFFGEGDEPFLYMAATRALHSLKILKEINK